MHCIKVQRFLGFGKLCIPGVLLDSSSFDKIKFGRLSADE
jgi:hypothetical protein